jgi:hypothetical protein
MEEAYPITDDLLKFQLYSWCFHNFQRFKYHRSGFGIFDTVNRKRGHVLAEVDAAAEAVGDYLRLNNGPALPDYYRYVDFHQHTGGVNLNPIDGLSVVAGLIRGE